MLGHESIKTDLVVFVNLESAHDDNVQEDVVPNVFLPDVNSNFEYKPCDENFEISRMLGFVVIK